MNAGSWSTAARSRSSGAGAGDVAVPAWVRPDGGLGVAVPLQRGAGGAGEGARGLVPGRRFLGHPGGDDLVEQRRRRVVGRGARRGNPHVGVHEDRQPIALVGLATGHELVEQARQGIDVGLLGDRAFELLGRHVREAAENGAGTGQRVAAAGALRSGDAEIREVAEVAVGGVEQNVGRFDVAVDEPVRVGLVEGACELLDDGDGPIGGERPGGDEIGEVPAVDVAHVDVQLTVDLAVAVDRDDVRAAQSRHVEGFATEPLLELGLVGEVADQPLERDGAAVLVVVGPVDLTHPAASEQLHQSIRPEDIRISSHDSHPT